MVKLKRLIVLAVGACVALSCFSVMGNSIIEKGIVSEIVAHSLTTHIKFPPDFFADITWVVAPGTFVKGPIYDKDGNKIRKGDMLVKCDPRYFEAKLDVAEGVVSGAKGELKDAKIDYERQKKLVTSKTISEKERDQAEAALYNAMGTYKSAVGELELAKIKLGYCQLEAPYDGFVGEVYITKGGWSNIDYPVARLDRLSPLYVNVEIDRETAKKVLNQELSVTLKVNGLDSAIGVYNNNIELSDKGLKIPVDNYILPYDKKIEGENAIIVSDVTPVLRFDLAHQNNGVLSVAQNCIFKDDKGFYVWKAVGQKTMQAGKTLDSKFKVEKIYVVPGNEFRDAISGLMQKLDSAGNLKEYDCLLTKEPKGIADGKEVIYRKIHTLLWPGDEVSVIIG